jgi:hypothetical protein
MQFIFYCLPEIARAHEDPLNRQPNIPTGKGKQLPPTASSSDEAGPSSATPTDTQRSGNNPTVAPTKSLADYEDEDFAPFVIVTSIPNLPGFTKVKKVSSKMSKDTVPPTTPSNKSTTATAAKPPPTLPSSTGSRQFPAQTSKTATTAKDQTPPAPPQLPRRSARIDGATATKPQPPSTPPQLPRRSPRGKKKKGPTPHFNIQ